MSVYTDSQLPPSYAHAPTKSKPTPALQQHYQPQPQHYRAYHHYPAASQQQAPPPAYAYGTLPWSSPPPSLYSASTASSYSFGAPISSNELIPMYSPPAPAPQQQRPVAPRVVSPVPKELTSRVASNDALATIIASQERAIASAKKRQKNARSESPMVQRRDYRIPKNSTAKNPLSDGIHPEKYQMKKYRKKHTVAGATSGAFIGGLLTGPAFPVGMVIGAAAGGYATNKVHKMQERRRQRRHEQRNFQKAAKQTMVAKSESIAFV